MIYSVFGKIEKVGADFAVVNVGGIGFKIFVLDRFLTSAKIGKEEKFFCFFNGENFYIYGFKSEDELFLFEKLLKVSGIGPKIAKKILNEILPVSFRAILSRQDIDLLSREAKISKKMASKIIIELKNLFSEEGKAFNSEFYQQNKEVADVLRALGYQKSDINFAAEQVKEFKGNLEEGVKFALRAIALRNKK